MSNIFKSPETGKEYEIASRKELQDFFNTDWGRDLLRQIEDFDKFVSVYDNKRVENYTIEQSYYVEDGDICLEISLIKAFSIINSVKRKLDNKDVILSFEKYLFNKSIFSRTEPIQTIINEMETELLTFIKDEELLVVNNDNLFYEDLLVFNNNKALGHIKKANLFSRVTTRDNLSLESGNYSDYFEEGEDNTYCINVTLNENDANFKIGIDELRESINKINEFSENALMLRIPAKNNFFLYDYKLNRTYAILGIEVDRTLSSESVNDKYYNIVVDSVKEHPVNYKAISKDILKKLEEGKDIIEATEITLSDKDKSGNQEEDLSKIILLESLM